MLIEAHQRLLEIRRHAERTKPGQHLSRAGIDRACIAGVSGLPIARVVTSPSPRAVETAVAMGYPVDHEESVLQSFGAAIAALIDWNVGFANWQQGVAESPVLAAFATLQAAIWRQVLTDILPGQAALIVTHGGMIEAGVMAMAPALDWSVAGDALDYVEGVRLWFHDDRCVNVIVLRFNGNQEDQLVIPVPVQSH
jgi:broad specificity phosphatase PhoE